MPAPERAHAAGRGAATVAPVGRGTHPRGEKDATAKSPPSLVRTAAPRAFVVTMLIAALVHAPLVPTRIFDWLSLLLGAQDVEIADMDGEVVIPIDLDLVPGQTAPAPRAKVEEPAPAEPVEAAEPTPAATAKPPKKSGPADAGTDAEAPDAGEDAGIADAGGDAEVGADAGSDGGDGDAGAPIASLDDAGSDAGVIARAPEDAGPDAENVPAIASITDAGADASAPQVKEAVAAAGNPGEFAGKNPNVQVLIASDRIRQHDLGKWFGRILVTIPQWQGFFKDTPIDPIRDLDHVVIAGPQFKDSRKVVAVMDFNIAEPKIRESLDLIIKRSNPPGKWLDKAPVPAAQAKADNGDRIFAMVPGKRMLVVLPADAKDKLAQVKGIKPFNKSSAEGIVLSMVTPHRAFKGLPVAIPDTLKWMRLSVTPTPDGGANLLLEALDENAISARDHAEKLGALIESIRQVDIPLIGKFEIIGPTSFTSDGDLIRATSHVTNKQLRYIMSKAEQDLARQAKEAEAKASKSGK